MNSLFRIREILSLFADNEQVNAEEEEEEEEEEQLF